MKYLDSISWSMLILICLTLGLAPFNPPHVWEKFQMLRAGTLNKPLDWFDFIMHGSPWVLLIVKIIAEAIKALKKV